MNRFFRKMFGIADPNANAAPPPGYKPIDTATFLSAIPHMHPHVKKVVDPRRGYTLTWEFTPPDWKPAKTWLGGLRNPQVRTHTLILDAIGHRVVELVDDKRSVGEIADILAAETGHSMMDMRKALIGYVTTLAKKNVIVVAER